VKSSKQQRGVLTPSPALRGPGEATLRIGATIALPSVLRALGADPAALLAEAGFDPALFDDPDNLVSLAARGRLLNHCVARTGCQHLGLLIGQQGGLQSLGLTGLLVKYSPDVGTALRSLERYLHLHVRGASTTLAVVGHTAMLSYEIHEPMIEATEQVGDGAVALLFNIMRSLCGAEWKPTEVRLVHRKPGDVAPFRRFFGMTPHFDAEEYALTFSADWLRRPLPETDPQLRRLLQKQVDALEARHGRDFPEQVRSVLRTSIITGQASADQVAAIFSMHTRTLNRRLHGSGTRFRELVDDARFEIARQMLETSAMEMTQIATMLGYADASAFTRAFRRWSGTTPTLWRATRDRQVA
jgi:AraC-like DNA-binding protein